MTLKQFVKPAGAIAVLTAIALAATLSRSRPLRATDADDLDHLFSRNLTPDKTGLPEGGRTFAEFLQIFRTGVDLDHLHPTCSAGQTNCVPPPFKGELLQVMPWPIQKNMTEHDLRAIYEYL